jgi:predicted metal-dependent hydrolase
MKKLMIFGKNVTITEQELNKEYLDDILHSQLLEIYNKIKKEGKIEIFGDLDFEIVEKINNKKQRIAKLNRNKIQVKLNTITLPKSALKYIIAHEIAHTFTKKHTKRFWKIVETIYPNYEKGRKLLIKHGKFLYDPLTKLPE